MEKPNIRTGLGYDVHCLVPNRPLTLGGITIPHTHGLLGHSDADVLIHAICADVLAHALMDALLGAAALGDIGRHFPDTSSEFLGIDSCILLHRVVALLNEKGYAVGNVDAIIVAQAPKLSPHIQAMREKLAPIMNVSPDDINIKATTTECLGFEGRKEGISAQAVALIYKTM